jgi:hypothetical protein
MTNCQKKLNLLRLIFKRELSCYSGSNLSMGEFAFLIHLFPVEFSTARSLRCGEAEDGSASQPPQRKEITNRADPADMHALRDALDIRGIDLHRHAIRSFAVAEFLRRRGAVLARCTKGAFSVPGRAPAPSREAMGDGCGFRFFANPIIKLSASTSSVRSNTYLVFRRPTCAKIPSSRFPFLRPP